MKEGKGPNSSGNIVLAWFFAALMVLIVFFFASAMTNNFTRSPTVPVSNLTRGIRRQLAGGSYDACEKRCSEHQKKCLLAEKGRDACDPAFSVCRSNCFDLFRKN